MAKHVIEYDAKCKACNGSDLYVGMAERDGAAVVCQRCDGTGEVHHVIKYEDFEGKSKRRGVKRVYEVNPGIGIGTGETKKHGKFTLEDFGGMSYKDWLDGKPFPPKSEMRKFTCPAWWYQSADYDKKPNWCTGRLGCVFSECEEFENKEKCWERFDGKK